MSLALFTTGQSRWALHILLGILSAVAIASSAPAGAGGELTAAQKFAVLTGYAEGATMFSGFAGDIRGLIVVMGSIGLGGLILLLVYPFLACSHTDEG